MSEVNHISGGSQVWAIGLGCVSIGLSLLALLAVSEHKNKIDAQANKIETLEKLATLAGMVSAYHHAQLKGLPGFDAIMKLSPAEAMQIAGA